MKWMRMRKRAKVKKSDLKKDTTKANLLAAVWDSIVLRDGDKTTLGESSNLHPNRWGTIPFLRVSWGDLGKNRCARGQGSGCVGIEETHRGSEALGLLAMFWHELEKSKASELLDVDATGADALSNAGACLIQRHYDCTPLFVRFGVLQDLLETHARYVIRTTDDRGFERWEVVTHEAYRKQYPRAATTKGVVELLGQSARLDWTSRATAENPVRLHSRRHIHVPPMFLQAGNANCFVDALSRASPLLSLGGITQMRQRVAWVWLNEVLDGASSCKRQQAYLVQALRRINLSNCLCTKGACIIHKLHRVIVKGTRENDLIGNVHALQVVYGITSKRESMLLALKWVIGFLDVVLGEPDPVCLAMQKELVDHTLLRGQKHVRGRRSQHNMSTCHII